MRIISLLFAIQANAAMAWYSYPSMQSLFQHPNIEKPERSELSGWHSARCYSAEQPLRKVAGVTMTYQALGSDEVYLNMLTHLKPAPSNLYDSWTELTFYEKQELLVAYQSMQGFDIFLSYEDDRFVYLDSPSFDGRFAEFTKLDGKIIYRAVYGQYDVACYIEKKMHIPYPL